MGKTTTRGPDAKLLRLYAEFKAAFKMMDAAFVRVEGFESQGRKKRMRAAEAELEKLTEAADAVTRKILRARASTPAGMMVKVRVEEIWPGTFEDDELLASIIADVKAIAGGVS